MSGRPVISRPSAAHSCLERMSLSLILPIRPGVSSLSLITYSSRRKTKTADSKSATTALSALGKQKKGFPPESRQVGHALLANPEERPAVLPEDRPAPV